MKTQNINLIRGDTNIITFTLVGENGDAFVVDEQDKLYFTVKETVYDTEPIIQKTLDRGITFNTDTEEYEIEVTNECTCNLPFCTFVYDIELVVIRDGKRLVKTIVKGNFTISEEVTHKENEI